MHKAYKYRIYPTSEQEKILIEWLGQLRFVWNQFLELNIKKYESEKKFIFKYDLMKLLPDMKKQHVWMTAPSQSFQIIAFHLDSALRNKFKHKMGFPRFKKKGLESGIKIPQTNNQIKINKNTIKIPKLGEIKWVQHRELVGDLKSITITRDVDQWYVSCLCEENINILSKKITSIENDITGLDLGIKYFLVDSNGVVIDSPKYLKQSQKQLSRYQRQYSRKKKGSNNQNKARIKVARLHRRIRKQRADFHHKLSNQIANENSIVICEDLAVKNLTKNHKLAKAISDQGWSQFISFLDYKLQWRGGRLVKIDRFAPSSQLCSCCGHRQKLSLDIRTYICPKCGLVCNRDYNAALNIKSFGLEILNKSGTDLIHACRDTSSEELAYDNSSYVSVKQEAAYSSESR